MVLSVCFCWTSSVFSVSFLLVRKPTVATTTVPVTAISAALKFSNLPKKPTNPFKAAGLSITAAAELARALDHVKTNSSGRPASSDLLTTPNDNPVVEHWREAARAAALTEHD